MKNLFIITIFTFCVCEKTHAQLMKSFEDKNEWLLSYKVYEYGLDIKDYKSCADFMDNILEITDTPDKSILAVGVQCYVDNNQKEKAIEITREFSEKGYISPCDDDTFSELLDKPCDTVEPITNPDLKEQLVDMLIVDQYYRGFSANNALADMGYATHHDSLLNYGIQELDKINQFKLKAIFKRYGFPTKDMVGQLGLNSIHFILQHADNDTAFQKLYLDDIKRLVDRKEMEPQKYAYFLDRVLVGTGKPQIYGTQQIPDEMKVLCNYQPMKDPEGVNDRRMKMGMMPMEYYLRIHYQK